MDVMNHEGSSTTSFCKVEAVHMYYIHPDIDEPVYTR